MPLTIDIDPQPSEPRGSDRIWSILCHLSAFLGVGFILPLVVFLAMKGDSTYVRDNAREVLNFHITLLIYGLCCLPLMLVLIGIPMLVILGLAAAILSIVGAIKASENACYRYPFTLRLIK